MQPVRISHKESDSNLYGDSLTDGVHNSSYMYGFQPSQTIWEFIKVDRCVD